MATYFLVHDCLSILKNQGLRKVKVYLELNIENNLI